jgi:hypothetical protein
MHYFLIHWPQYYPWAGLAVIVLIVAYFTLRRREPDLNAIERERRLYLNRIGRIVEGQIVEIEDRRREDRPRPKGFINRRKNLSLPRSNGNGEPVKMLFYTYSISGVTYETAQDISGLEERACLTRAIAGQAASVKYDPSNPSNSILLADDWSGLH